MGLTIRMLLAFALAVLVWAATLGAFTYFVLLSEYWFLALLLLFGFAAEGYEAQSRRRARRAGGGAAVRAQAALQRLALAADTTAPAVVVEQEPAALSWTLWPPLGKPRIHVTTGLLERLDDPQLEAVVAHELTHVINRDAQLMTGVGLLPALLLDGLGEMLRKYPVRGILSVVVYGLWFTPSAVLLLACARIVSRHRELAADAGAARLTGSAAAVASALLTLAGDPRRDRDLRRADLFYFLPRRERRGLWATHPPLRSRLDRLERLERELQG